ncbi:LysE family translocator [Pseudolysinimonas sp.]|jgi:threonine/homoserine/homoserine lactone efflux protein|uniref:LysE family translocator n=1 Tax=Pseudolysinimonas sp. TaxID=2680009 RepID=UPI0037840CD7
MLPLPNLLAFLAAAVVLVIMPGPTVLFVVGRSLALGRRGGLLSVLGNAIGILPIIVAVSFGVGAIVTESVVVFTIIKVAGAAYLVFLGIQAIRHRTQTALAVQSGSTVPKTTWRLLGEGFVVGISNPKTIAFFVAVLPQFVAPEAGWVPGQMLLLGGIFVVLALVSDGAWAFAAGSARDWFARSPKRVERLGATGGVMMIGLGGVLALTGAKD